MKSIAIVTSAMCLIALAPCSYGQRFATLYTVTGDNPVGLAWARGVLYGSTSAYSGEGFNCGTVYQLQPSAKGSPWLGTVLYSFPSGLDAPCAPAQAPVVGAGGSIYGTTVAGGSYISGVFYDLQPPPSPGDAWTEGTLYDFDNPSTDIGYAASGLVKGPNGSFYILTADTNSAPAELCQLHPPSSPGGPWTATVLYSFPFGALGGPLNSLVAGRDGALYGTNAGGAGAVLKFTPPPTPGDAWTETMIHSFGSNPRQIADNPIALTVAADGTIYGTAYGRNPPLGSGYSAIFQLTPPATPDGKWAYKNLTAPTNAEHFNTAIVLVNGNLYGTTSTGNGGSIYELQPPLAPGGTWTMTTLYTFTDGQVPGGNLVAGPDGLIFGTTAAAPGQPSGGTVFAIATN